MAKQRFVLTFSLVTAGILSTSHLSAQAAPYDGPIVDVHVHAFSRMVASERICFPQPCQGRANQVSDPSELLGATLAAMDDRNIVLGVLSGGRGNMRLWMAGNEDRFLPGVQIANPDGRAEQLRMLVATDSVSVIGEITSQYQHVPADDERLDPIFALAHELDLPVLLHLAGLGGSEDFPTHLGSPQRLAPVLGKYPGLRIYIENAGWPYLEEMTSLMYQYPTVHADISTILHLLPSEVSLKYIEGLVANGLSGRLMFGSDQMSWPEVMGEAIDVLQGADFLSGAQKADIFYNNAARFFRFSDEQIRAHHGR